MQATHKYVGEDVDELTFEPGEIITVVPFDDPEEQVHAVNNFVPVLKLLLAIFCICYIHFIARNISCFSSRKVNL